MPGADDEMAGLIPKLKTKIPEDDDQTQKWSAMMSDMCAQSDALVAGFSAHRVKVFTVRS
jgi:hypothetical protein